MERFMWSFDGRKFSEVVEPIRFARDERVRVTLVNDTMMQHPIHLHGHFFEVVNGHPGRPTIFEHRDPRDELRRPMTLRSEERRGGKEGVSTVRTRWSPYHKKKKKK